jgi:DNA-binding MarR family transcriptional regulator
MLELAPEEYRALADFRFQLRLFLRFSEDAARAAGLEPSQHQLLLALKAAGELNVGALAKRLQLRHHSVVGLLDRLAGRGLVLRRRDDPDRRHVHVTLTPAGDDMLRALSVQHRDELRAVAPRLVHALTDLLGKVPPFGTGTE